MHEHSLFIGALSAPTFRGTREAAQSLPPYID